MFRIIAESADYYARSIFCKHILKWLFPVPDDGPALGRVIELRRTALGFKRKDLAERAGLSYPYISEIENGVKEPSAKAMRKIADALELTVAELAVLGERVRETPGSLALVVDAAATHALEIPSAPGPAARLTSAVSPESTADPHMSLVPALHRELQALVRAEVADWMRSNLGVLVRKELKEMGAQGEEPS